MNAVPWQSFQPFLFQIGAMAVPPSYSDLGKSAKDIFSKGYGECVCKTTVGMSVVAVKALSCVDLSVNWSLARNGQDNWIMAPFCGIHFHSLCFILQVLELWNWIWKPNRKMEWWVGTILLHSPTVSFSFSLSLFLSFFLSLTYLSCFLCSTSVATDYICKQ